jgi:hypothetical protein
LLRVEDELAARGYPLELLPFRDLVLNAGGEDWKFGVGFISEGADSMDWAISARGLGFLLVGLVSGMASALDVASISAS